MFVRRVYALLGMLPMTFCLCLLFTFLCTSPTWAATHTQQASHTTQATHASDPITILSETYTISYPKSIDFQINVRDAQANITGATIFLSVPAPRYLNEAHVVTINTVAQTETVTWHEDTNTHTFLSPGTQVTYYWQFRDAIGTYSEAPQNITVTDTRFTWQHLTQNLLQVNWYNRPTDFGQAVLTQAMTSINRISSNLGGGLSRPVNLWVYQNDTDFRGALPPSAHEWVGGIAFIDLNQAMIVAQDAEDTTMIRDMPHELAHLVFHQLTAQGIYAPVWFDEGLAVYNQLYQEPDMSTRFKQALAAHDLLRFDKLTVEFPADADQAYLAYAQSWNMIGYIYKTFGRTKMQGLIQSMNNAQTSFDSDLQKNLGEDELHLENNWRLSLGQPGILLPVSSILTPQTSTQPKVQSPFDSNAPLYLLIGGLLILLPSGGIIFFLVSQRRRQKVALAAQAQHMLNATLLPPASFMPPTYAQPTKAPYYAHPSLYTQHPPYGNYPPAGNVGTDTRQISPNIYGPQRSGGPHNLPNPQSPQAQHASGPQMPFVPGQEYLGQQPPKQAPQD